LIYCNVSDCSNWEELEIPAQRKRPVGHVPLIPAGEIFNGICSRASINVSSSTALSSGGRKQFVHACESYNSTDEESPGIVCTESRCLYNTLSKECERTEIYIETKKIFDRSEGVSDLPVCESFSNRKHENAVDWRRIAEGGYNSLSSAPDSRPSFSGSSGPRRMN